MEQDKRELCSVTVVFPANSDEQALDIKKKIQATTSDIPEAVIDFRLRSTPSKPM